MKYSSSQRKIIPDDPFYLMGYVGEARDVPALGIVDEPSIQVVCWQTEHETLLFVSVDVVVVSRDKSDIIKNHLANTFNLDEKHINISAIHSHSCANGLSSGGFNNVTDNPKYFNKVSNAIYEATQDVLNSLEEVEVQLQISEITGYYSNRNDKSVPYDNKVYQLNFFNMDKIHVGTLINIACHSTVLGPHNRYLSYDLLGSIRELHAQEYDVPVAVFMGAAGDISNRQYRQGDDFDELKRTAKGIYSQIEPVVYQDTNLNTEAFKSQEFEYEVRYDNKPNHAGFRDKLRVLETSLNDPNISKDQYKLDLTSKIILESKLNVDIIDKKILIKHFEFEDFRIVCFGGELSSLFGTEIRRAEPTKPTLIFTCVDDHQGYFIEEDKYGQYYETITTDIPKGTPELIVKEIVESIHAI